jgi:hypothetical protein
MVCTDVVVLLPLIRALYCCGSSPQLFSPSAHKLCSCIHLSFGIFNVCLTGPQFQLSKNCDTVNQRYPKCGLRAVCGPQGKYLRPLVT